MHTIDYVIVAVYLMTIVGVGLVLQRKASQGIDSYFLGNRNLPWWVLGASGMASNTDIAGTMINTAFIYALGTKGFFIEIRGGVTLIMAFLMVFMGKWNRRAKVMTLAEWMHLRFGKEKEGDLARIIMSIAMIVMTIAMVTYFVIGAGKFVGEFLGIHPRLASILMIVLAMIYTVASGLYGVVWTDVFQGTLIFGTIIYICIMAMRLVDLPTEFLVSVPLKEGGFQTIQTTLAEWTRILPPIEMNMPAESTYSIYNLFGIAIMFYLFKVTLEGSGGTGGYMIQRYFAAKSDREAGLLSLFWTFLLSFRWPLIASFAMLGIYYGIHNQVIADPELVLPTVIGEYIPTGVKGLLVAGLMAAAMSTFDSTVNAGAAYWVKDLYQTYINPKASEKQLMAHSRVASIVIVLLALLVSYTVRNINDIWGWITMGIGSGLLIPQLLRWYWWRFNGYGFAIGVGAGMTAAILTRAFGPANLPEYVSFIIGSGSSLAGCILGTYFTAPTDHAVLDNFYKITRPFGFWGRVRNNLPADSLNSIHQENRRDIFATFLAVPWQVILFMTGMMIVMGRWENLGTLGILLVLLSVGLYYSWFRHLSKEVKVKE